MTQPGNVAACVRKLEALWTAILGIHAATPEDNFFSLGGNSLVLVHLLASIQGEFGVVLEPDILFDHPTLQEMAEQIVRHQTRSASHDGPVALGRVAKRVSPNQERHWIFRDKRIRLYNLYYEANISGLDSPARLLGAFADTVENNRVFKFIFQRREDGVYAVPCDEVPALTLTDLRNIDPREGAGRLEESRRRVSASDFDIWREVAFSAEYAMTGPGEGVLMFCANHILLDLESLGIFFAELYARYCDLPVRAKEIDFYDVAAWQRHTESVTPEALEGYWRQKLAPYTQTLRFSGRNRPEAHVGTGAVEKLAIVDPKALRFLRSVDSTRPPLFIKVMSTIALAVFAQYQEAPLAVSYPTAVRPHPAAADIVGNFLTHNFFILDPREDVDLTGWLAANNRQFIADVIHRQLNILDKEALLPASMQTFYGKCQIRYQFYDMTLGAPPPSGSLQIRRPEERFEKALADLHFFVELRESSLHIMLVYYSAIFSREEILALLHRLKLAIESLESLTSLTLPSIVARLGMVAHSRG